MVLYYCNMKQVLLIDATQMFREFLKEKLMVEKIDVEVASGNRDAFTKLISILPDLVIIDINDSIEENILEFFQKKQKDPNAKNIPVIISGPSIEREKVAALVQFGVIKYFAKPIKFDIFFESIGKVLKANFSIDVTPCVLEVHLNQNIIFIEIAQGLNREKLYLLKYRIAELINQNKLTDPKVIIMMTALDLSFVDGANLELLFDNVLADSRINKKNVKVLSLNDFTKDLIEGHPQYFGIEVVKSLSAILNSVVPEGDSNSVQELITDRILTSSVEDNQLSVEMRFSSDNGAEEDFDDDEQVQNVHIAIVDDDEVILKLLGAVFTKLDAQIDLYNSSVTFTQSILQKNYDILILDIFMAGLSGFDIIKFLHAKKPNLPIIVYSQATQKEIVIQALSLGAKSYLVKPQKPDTIVAKVRELLNGRI